MNTTTPVIWQYTRCPLCRADDAGLVLTLPGNGDTTDYRLVRCHACGLGYLNPRPAPESIAHYYPLDYASYQAPGRRRPRTGWEAWLERLVLAHYFDFPAPKLRWHERLLARLGRCWLGPRSGSLADVPFTGSGRLLDYGCGSGAFAERMRQLGWDVVAMDFNPHSLAQVRQRHPKLTCLAGNLPHPAVPAESFDAVTLGSVLEHVHEPHALIAAIVRILRPGGTLVASVPNLDSWNARDFGTSWLGLELPRHLLHFTPVPLRRLVEAHGLHVRRLTLPGRTGWTRKSLKMARAMGRDSLLVKLGRLPLAASLLTHLAALTRQADCIQITAVKPARAPRLASLRERPFAFKSPPRPARRTRRTDLDMPVPAAEHYLLDTSTRG